MQKADGKNLLPWLGTNYAPFGKGEETLDLYRHARVVRGKQHCPLQGSPSSPAALLETWLHHAGPLPSCRTDKALLCLSSSLLKHGKVTVMSHCHLPAAGCAGQK